MLDGSEPLGIETLDDDNHNQASYLPLKPFLPVGSKDFFSSSFEKFQDPGHLHLEKRLNYPISWSHANTQLKEVIKAKSASIMFKSAFFLPEKIVICLLIM